MKESHEEAQGHQAERAALERAIRLAAWIGLLGRGLSLTAGVLVLPIALRGVGSERYGVWLTLASAMALLKTLDLGVSSALISQVAQASGQKDALSIRRLLSAALSVCILLASAFALVTLLALPWLPWSALLQVHNPALRDEVLRSVLIAGLLTAFSLPAALLDRFHQSLQEAHIAGRFAIAGTLTMMAALTAVAHYAPTLPALVLTLGGTPILFQYLAALYAFRTRWRHLRPAWAMLELGVSRKLLRTGAMYVLIQLSAVAVWQTDNLVVSQLFGPSAVTRYSVSFQLATTYVGLASLWLAPYWPAFAEAFGRKDYLWARRQWVKILWISQGMAWLGALGFFLLGPWFITHWVGEALVPSLGLRSAVAAYLPTILFCIVLSTPLNAMGSLRGMAIYGSVAAILNIVLSLWLGSHFGLPGVCWATSLSAAGSALMVGLELRTRFRELHTPSASVISSRKTHEAPL